MSSSLMFAVAVRWLYRPGFILCFDGTPRCILEALGSDFLFSKGFHSLHALTTPWSVSFWRGMQGLLHVLFLRRWPF